MYIIYIYINTRIDRNLYVNASLPLVRRWCSFYEGTITDPKMREKVSECKPATSHQPLTNILQGLTLAHAPEEGAHDTSVHRGILVSILSASRHWRKQVEAGTLRWTEVFFIKCLFPSSTREFQAMNMCSFPLLWAICAAIFACIDVLKLPLFAA